MLETLEQGWKAIFSRFKHTINRKILTGNNEIHNRTVELLL